jgi:hypothetical protein
MAAPEKRVQLTSVTVAIEVIFNIVLSRRAGAR